MKTVDVGSELAELRGVLASAQFLADLLARDDAPNAETLQRLPVFIASTLNLAVERMALIEKVLNGSRSAADAAAHFNSVAGPEGTHVAEWSPERRRAECERELRLLNFQKGRSRRRSP